MVLDMHSYNHRRDGQHAPPSPVVDNPEVNIGTGWLDRDRWGHVVDRFIEDLRRRVVADHHLDVRENVRFRGRPPDASGCTSATTAWGAGSPIELKKVFMDEWTGVADEDHLRQLTRAFADAVPVLLGELACGPA